LSTDSQPATLIIPGQPVVPVPNNFTLHNGSVITNVWLQIMHDISREKCNADDHSRKANKLVATAKNRSKKRLFCQMSTNSDTPT